MDELGRIQTFIKVVEAGSFSAVARHTLSVSSVARQVKSLEDELGVRLLNRSTRSLSLTEPGRCFYERACAIARELGNAKSEAQSFQDNVKGVLRLSLRVAAGTNVIVPALPAFLAQYPELKVDITLTDERRDLVAENIDVAVWSGQLPDSDVVARRLSPSRRILCASPAYLARRGTPLQPEDLRQHDCLRFTAPSYGGQWQFSKDGQHETIEVDGGLRTDNGLVLFSSAMSGMGLIVVHEWMVTLQIAQGTLVRVLGNYTVNPKPGNQEQHELHVVYPSSRGLSRKVRVFVDFLVQLFGADGAAQAVPVAQPAPGP